jgi:hypothetical protein
MSSEKTNERESGIAGKSTDGSEEESDVREFLEFLLKKTEAMERRLSRILR